MPQTKRFLATTALEEFWDTSQPMLFLGEWCKRYDKMTSLEYPWWENLDAEILQSDLLKDLSSHDVFEYTIKIYENLLSTIANWLNKIHGKKYSLRYWQIVIGPFLLWYVQVVFHRYTHLKVAHSLYPNLTTIGLSESSYVVPVNTKEFSLFAAESDAWNLQLCTQLLILAFNIPIIFRDFSFEAEFKQREKIFGKQPPYKKLTTFKLNLVRLIAKSYGSKSVGLCATMFEKKFIKKLVLLSKFRLLPLLPMERVNQAAFGKKPLNQKIRDEISKLPALDNFSRLVLETLKINMPLNFIECYKEAAEQSEQCYPYRPGVIVGAGWMEDDVAKMWGAKNVEEGSSIIDVQHGGGYGASEYSSYEYQGRKNCDAFISWGWKENQEVVSAPSTLICERYKEKKWGSRTQNKNNLILWSITESNRYLSYMESSMESMKKSYFDWQVRFSSKLEKKVLSNLEMRLRPSSKYFYYLKKRLPNLQMFLPNNRGDFFEQLFSSKILVCDNLNTVLHYGLAFNVPTILFWDENLFAIREEAKPYFKLLEDAGIYHSSPEHAAKKLNEIFLDPNPWWNSEIVQLARKKFCDNYARLSSSWISDWRDMLLTMSQKYEQVHDLKKRIEFEKLN